MACIQCCPCVLLVQTSNVRMVESCGAFTKIAPPGCTCLIPCVHTAKENLSMRLQMNKVESDTKTLDNVFVKIVTAVQYQVIDDGSWEKGSSRYNAFYKLSRPESSIQSYVNDVVRSAIPKLDLDKVFLAKEQIADQIQTQLKSRMQQFGYEILASPIIDINPANEVKQAMNDINKAKRLRIAAEDEGEAAKITAVKHAEAEAGATEIQARADAEAKYLAGAGISRQRSAIMEGLRESVNDFRRDVKDVDAKAVMHLMVVTQYFDMMKDVGAQQKTNAIFLNGGGSDDLSSAVSKGFLSGLPAAPGFAQR